MPSFLPRRDFLKTLMAAPFLGGSTVAPARESRYDFAVFPVAGFCYYDGPGLLDRIRAGDPVTLVREPDNPHDDRAIRVEALGRRIGYVPRSENRPLARLLEQGAELSARVVGVQPQSHSWDAVRVGVSLHFPGT
ncbi:MAG: HIRAN domain-containing protein [Gammaproteobacteria bacterium]|jgi:hypothetical protein